VKNELGGLMVDAETPTFQGVSALPLGALKPRRGCRLEHEKQMKVLQIYTRTSHNQGQD
jgi:hypothetical protein